MFFCLSFCVINLEIATSYETHFSSGTETVYRVKRKQSIYAFRQRWKFCGCFQGIEEILARDES